MNSVVSDERAKTVSGSTKKVYPEDTQILGYRYTSRDVMALENEKLWPRVWDIGAWAAEISEPGDFVTYQLGRESI